MSKHTKSSVRGLIPYALLSIFLFVNMLQAQTRGKISGKVTDASTGQPLPGANVLLQHTSMGAAADLQGNYFILNIPPGVYNLEARYMGYQPLIIEDVHVVMNHNRSVNISLKEEVLEGKTVTVTAKRAEKEMVKMDLPTAAIVINVKEIVEIPADDLVAMLSLQPGVEFIEGVGNDDPPLTEEIYGDDHQARAAAQGISIRGGESRETLVFLDGMSLVNQHEDVSYTGFGKTAIEAMQVLTGGLSAEYGNASSGAVNVVTREMSRGYRLDFEGKYSPAALKHFGPSIHDQNNPLWKTFGSEKSITGEGTPFSFPGGWQAVAKNPPVDGLTQPESYRLLWRYLHRKTRDYAFDPDTEFDGTLSGNLPIGGRLSFLLSFRQKKNMLIYPSMERPYYLHRNYYLKMGWNLNPSMKIYMMGLYGETFSMNPGRQDGFRAYLTGDPQNFSSLLFPRDAFNPSTLPKRDMYRTFGSLGFTHNISKNTYYKLQATYQHSRFHQPRSEFRDRTPVFWIYQDYMTGSVYSTQNRGDFTDENGDVMFPYMVIYELDEQPEGLGSGIDDPAPREYAMNLTGKCMTQDFSKNHNVNVRFDLTSQRTSWYQLQCGAEFYTFDLRQYVTFGQEEPPRFVGALANPWEVRAYTNHRLEFGDMIANLGLSVQWFDPNIHWFDYVGENKFNKEKLDWRKFHTVEHEEYNYWNFWHDTLPMRTRRAERKLYFSPRLGISHPVSVNGKLFLSYGIYRQTPDTRDMYHLNARHRPNVTYLRMGNPYLEFPVNTVSEIGYQHNIYDLFVVGISAYFKSVEKAINRKEFYSLNRDIDYLISVNESWQKMRGIEISMQKPFGRWITGWFNYNYMVYSGGHYGIRSECEDARESEYQNFIPDAPIPKPTARLAVTLNTPEDFGPQLWKFRLMAGWKASILYQYRGGGKTRLVYADPQDPTEPYVNIVDYHIVNGTLEKSIQFGSMNVSFYVEVRNLFNRKQLNLVAMDNIESYQRSLKLPFEEGEAYGNDKIGDYDKDYIDLSPFWWSNFLNPRDWWFGIRINLGK